MQKIVVCFVLLLMSLPILVEGQKIRPVTRPKISTAKLAPATPQVLRLAHIDKAVRYEMARQEIPGMAVGVIQNGNIVHVQAYGFVDPEETKPITTSTVFRWASISKTLTAAAVNRAMEEDRDIIVSDKVTKWVSYWPNSGRHGQITIKQLLQNTSGIGHYRDNGYKDYSTSGYTDKNWNSVQAVNIFKAYNPLHTPGTKYLYTSFGFNLLGAVVDEWAKKRGSDYVRYTYKMINRNPAFRLPSLKPADGYALKDGYYQHCDGRLRPLEEGRTIWKLPSGGWSSNIMDLTRFTNGLMQNAYLDNTQVLWLNGSQVNRNYTFGLNRYRRGNTNLSGHSGIHGNLKTQIYFDPGTKNGVAVMIPQGTGCSAMDVAVRVYNALLNPSSVPSVVVPVNNIPKEGSTPCGVKYTATWRDQPGSKKQILRKGYSTTALAKEREELGRHNFRISDIEAYVEDGQLRWDAVFEYSTQGNMLWRNLSTDAFGAKWREMAGKGFQLTKLEAYTTPNGQLNWAGIFEKGAPAATLWRNFDTESFGDKWREMKQKGFRIVDVETYLVNGQRRWAGIWVRGTGQAMFRNMTEAQLDAKVKSLPSQGFRILDLEAYRINGQIRYAGIWEKSNQYENRSYGASYNFIMRITDQGMHSRDMRVLTINRIQ